MCSIKLGDTWKRLVQPIDGAMPDTKYDSNLPEAIEALVERGLLDKGAPAYGVALVAIARGYDGLTRAQRGLFDRVIAPALDVLANPGKSPAPESRPNEWRPLREAPSDRDVQLGIKDGNGISPLSLACRKVGRGWVQSGTGKPLSLRPTHWREWPRE